MSAIVIATRGSALALAQADHVLERCRSLFPKDSFELRVVKTTGDKLQAESSAEVDLPKGLFTKELEVALMSGEADMAVHSLKDLPTELPPELCLGAVTTRADVRDVVIFKGEPKSSLSQLPPSFRFGTSSPRRKAQLLHARPDFVVEPIRGNVPTRVRKLVEENTFDALVLALAGLTRLGYSQVEGANLMILSVDEMLPCVGQGALGIEARRNDQRLSEILAKLNDAGTQRCVLAERAFLRAMGGGCQTPVGAYAEPVNGNIRLRAVSFSQLPPRRTDLTAPEEEWEWLGREVAAKLMA